MFLVVGLHGCLEGFDCAVDLLVDGYIHLGRGGPEHHHAVEAVLSLEVADVLAELLGHFPAGHVLEDVVTVETLCVVVVEGGLHGLDCLELVLDGEDVFFLEHLCVEGCFIGVGGIYVPRAKHDIVELGHGHYFVILEIFLVFALADAYLVVLSH